MISARAVPVYTSRMWKTFAVVIAFAGGAFAAGCGGGAAEGPKPTGGGTGGGAKPMAAGDVAFEVPPIEIKGVMFEPEALGRPGMPLVEAKKKTTIEKQRTVFANTKDPVQKEAQAAILATMLYQKSKDTKGDEQAALLKDARQVLRDAAAVSGDKVDEITLRLLGSYELILEDFPAAEKAWGTLVEKAPKDKDALFNRAWWAYSLLQEYKNAEALAAVKDQPLTDKQPELAYVTAWAKWRTGDSPGAWQAILVAAKGWGGNAMKDALDRDVLLLAGRTATTFDEALKGLYPIYASKGDQQVQKVAQYDLLAKLGTQSYMYAGRWADGVTAIEKAIALEGDKVPPSDRPVLRYTEADYVVRLDDPVTAAKYAKQALEALPACGQKCSDKDKENIVESVYIMGRLFHILYATAHDDRYYQPAHDLYAASVPLITMNDKVREEAAKDQANLEGSFKAMKAAAGTHDKGAIGALLGRHNQEVQACYEQGLAANPKLSGNLVVNIESDQTGAIKGVATEPKSGVQDMAMVAGCVATHAKAWTLPKKANGNGPTGVTRIKLTYAMGTSANKLSGSSGDAGKGCKCGDSYIDCSKTCHK
jgi:tetratricopeptide (TPR) repeat protein